MIKLTHHKPIAELSKYIRKISVFESKSKIEFTQKLTPSAFTYLSYNHLDIPTSIFGKKKVHPMQRLQIAGPKIDMDIYVQYNGRLQQILIEFTASGFYYLFHESPLKYANSLTALQKFSSRDEYFTFEEELKSTDDIQKQIELIEDFLSDRRCKALPFCDYIEKSIKAIEEKHGNIPIKKIAEKVEISERQLERKFLEVVGMNPKKYSQLTQLHYVINLMNTKNYASLQDIAFSAEYYDLPHFSHKFKELTGFTPLEFVNSDKHLALKFFKDLVEHS